MIRSSGSEKVAYWRESDEHTEHALRRFLSAICVLRRRKSVRCRRRGLGGSAGFRGSRWSPAWGAPAGLRGASREGEGAVCERQVRPHLEFTFTFSTVLPSSPSSPPQYFGVMASSTRNLLPVLCKRAAICGVFSIPLRRLPYRSVHPALQREGHWMLLKGQQSSLLVMTQIKGETLIVLSLLSQLLPSVSFSHQ